ncbi:MAG: hypothetical protein J6L74_00205, partial [Pseudomonas sp.]|nr:hypothetical protein [Pseudomonas sp.]
GMVQSMAVSGTNDESVINQTPKCRILANRSRRQTKKGGRYARVGEPVTFRKTRQTRRSPTYNCHKTFRANYTLNRK